MACLRFGAGRLRDPRGPQEGTHLREQVLELQPHGTAGVM